MDGFCIIHHVVGIAPPDPALDHRCVQEWSRRIPFFCQQQACRHVVCVDGRGVCMSDTWNAHESAFCALSCQTVTILSSTCIPEGRREYSRMSSSCVLSQPSSSRQQRTLFARSTRGAVNKQCSLYWFASLHLHKHV